MYLTDTQVSNDSLCERHEFVERYDLIILLLLIDFFITEFGYIWLLVTQMMNCHKWWIERVMFDINKSCMGGSALLIYLHLWYKYIYMYIYMCVCAHYRMAHWEAVGRIIAEIQTKEVYTTFKLVTNICLMFLSLAANVISVMFKLTSSITMVHDVIEKYDWFALFVLQFDFYLSLI